MTAPSAVLKHILSKSPWVDPANTCDRVVFGDADQPVTKAGVCWFPSIENIRAAAEGGCELLVTHEPSFYECEGDQRQRNAAEPNESRRGFLERAGMTVVRLHDSWDQWPEIGIRDSWAAGLQLTRRIATSEGMGLGHAYHALYEIEPQTLRDFADHVLKCIAPLGEDSVQVIGEADRRISKVAIGVGCITPDHEMIAAGADVLVGCFDGTWYWKDRERHHELGAAMLTVEHGTTEMLGIENLCRYLAETFTNVEFTYFDLHPKTWTVRSD